MARGKTTAEERELARLRTLLLRAAGSLSRSTQDAEDVVQTAFVRWWQMCESAPASASRPLLQTIVRRLAIDRSRQRRRWRMAALSDDAPDHAELPVAEGRWQAISPEQLYAALQTCSRSDREAFYMHYVQGLRYREIASALGIALGTVGTRLHRARLRLRAELEPMLDPAGREPRE